jgi:hypothetical protein
MSRFKKLTLLFVLSLAAGICLGQTVTTGATITDSDGFAWSGAKVQATWVPNPSYPNLNQYTLNGQSLATYAPYNSLLNQSIVTGGTGAFAGFVLLDNSLIQPAGSTYRFTVQSNTSAPATVYNPIQINSGLTSLTSFLSSNSIAPRFPAVNVIGAFGYGDVELTTTPNPGGMYFNTTTNISRQWNGTSWGNLAGGSAATINGQSSPFTFNGTVSNVGSTFTFTGGSGSFTLNTAELGAYSSGSLTHTNHYVIPPGQTLSQINSLIAAAPSGVYDFQRGDTVPQKFTPVLSNSQLQALVKHEGLPFYTYTINADAWSMVGDARQVNVQFSTASKTITVGLNSMSSYDIGKVMWIYNSTTQQAFETQILTVPTSLSFTVSSFPPWNQTTYIAAWVGTDNTTNAQNYLTSGSTLTQFQGAGFYTPPAKLTLSAGAFMSHTLNPSATGLEGAGPNVSYFIGAPGEDMFAAPDAYTTPTNQGAVHLYDFGVILEGGIDATQAWSLINDSGTSAKTALYRPAYVMTRDSNYPLAPEWCIGPNQNNTGCQSSVALTNGTTLACYASALLASQVPAVGQQVIFPYATGGLIETTVASTSGSCSGGASPRTLGTTIPSGTQSYNVFGTNIQHTSIDFPAGRSYPFNLTMANSIIPNPGSEYGAAPYGTIAIGAETCNYYNLSYVSNYYTITGCTGTSVDHPSTSYVAPLNPFVPTKPFVVTPTINSSDTTPTNSSFFPGHNIGNCVWAFPQSNGTTNQAQAWSNAHINDINIVQNNLPEYNNTCGFYFVGLGYATHYNDIRMSGTEYGIVQAQPSIENHNFNLYQPTADGSTWDKITIRAGYIMDIINANQNNFSNFDTYSQLGNSSGGAVGCGGGLFTSYGWDDQTGAQAGAMTLSTIPNFYIEPEAGTHCGQEFLMELDGYNNLFSDMHMGGGGYVQVGGVDEHWSSGNMNNSNQGLGYVAPIVNYGSGTVFDYTELVGSSPFCNTWNYLTIANSCTFINWGPKTYVRSRYDSQGPFGNPVFGNNRTIPDGQSNETFNTGNVGQDAYVHSGWGFIGPEEFAGGQFDPGPMNHNLWTFDSTAYTSQANVGCTVGNNTGFIYCAPYRFNDNFIAIGQGQRIAPGKYMVYFNMKSGLASNTANVGVGTCVIATGVCSNITGPVAIPVTNAYPATSAAVQGFVVDLSSYAAIPPTNSLQLEFYGAASADVIYTQYVDFAPLPENFNVNQLTVNGTGFPTYVNGSYGTETWQNAAPSTGCGSTYPNGSIWHNSSGTHAGLTLTYICNGPGTAWVGIF